MQRVTLSWGILGMARDFWTQDKIEQLVRLVREGHSFGSIGGIMGVSRCAISGKMLRLGIKSLNSKGTRVSGDQPRPPASKARQKRDKPVEALESVVVNVEAELALDSFESPPVETPKPPRERVRLPKMFRADNVFEEMLRMKHEGREYVDIQNIPGSRECRWISGDPKDKDAFWCRDPITHGKFCTTHAKLAYTPAMARGTGQQFKLFNQVRSKQ